MPNILSGDLDLKVAGLEKPAEIIVDRWGIPHIYAETRHDVFFAQGFNAARDRLWQLDIWRKRGLGRLAADLGPGYLAQDRAARLFLYRGEMDVEWKAYGDCAARETAEAFAAGLNAFIDYAEATPGVLPPEFAALGTRPARWSAEDIVRIRSHALVHNADSEVLRAKVTALAGAEIDQARHVLEPAWTPIAPDPLALETYPDDLLDTYRLATSGVTFAPDRLAATLAEAWRWRRVDPSGAVVAAPIEGSNNWAVAAERTATGRPILASDPHRAFLTPSLRYIAHLSAPGLDVIGAGEPALPGIAIGHNQDAGFGLTIFPIDQEDLHIYETDSADPDRYRYQGAWESMRIVKERIAVKGAPDQEVELRFTRHGPVICEDRARHRAYALRSVWFEPGCSAYFASLGYLAAATPEAFGKALAHWSVPAVNQVYADRKGNIAYFAAAKVPRREAWDGLYPVPGDGRFEWNGFHAASDLPRILNPKEGFVASANEMTLPAGYPYRERKLGFEWNQGFRGERVRAVLAGQARHTLADSRALQSDDFSLIAQRVCAHLNLVPHTAGRDLLAGWDFRMARESAAAALFEVWWAHHLKPALLATIAPDDKLRALLGAGSDKAMIETLNRMAARSRDATAATLERTLAAAFEECRAKFGAPEKASWGALHRVPFAHPLAKLLGEHHEPLPVAGTADTVMAAGYGAQSFDVDSGASFKMVLDVGAWDESVVLNAPGQSGDPRSPHYRDLAGRWNAYDYVPLLYSRAAVEEAAEFRIRLSVS